MTDTQRIQDSTTGIFDLSGEFADMIERTAAPIDGGAVMVTLTGRELELLLGTLREAASLRSEIERLKEDGARIDYLAKRGTFSIETYLGSEMVELDGEWEGEDFRSCIDAAREEQANG